MENKSHKGIEKKDWECKQCGIEGYVHIYDCPLGHTKHDFVYSHQESLHIYSTGTALQFIDVVICKDCGLVKRFNK